MCLRGIPEGSVSVPKTLGETSPIDRTAVVDRQALAQLHGLGPVSGRPPLRGYLTETWQRRAFAWQLAKSRHHAAIARTRLGPLWNILNPLLEVVLYGVIYYYLMGSANRPGNYTAFVTVGVVIYSFTARGMTSGARSIESNTGLVRSLRFPRAVLPIAVVLQNLLDLLPTMLLILPILLLTGEPVTWRWLLLCPAVILAALFALALAFFFSWLTAQLRDTLHLLPHANRAILHLSGIFWSLNQLSDAPWLQRVISLNPFGWYIDLTRGAVMAEPDAMQAASLTKWLVTTIVTAAALVAAFFLFWNSEERYGRD